MHLKQALLLFCFALLPLTYVHLSAQQYDIQWAVGGPPVAKMDFRNDTLINSLLDTNMATFNTVANMCDKNGNLLFWTNGIYIANRLGNKMVNGDYLSYPSEYYNLQTGGMSQEEGVVILPKPDDSTKYYLFHYTPTDTVLNVGGLMPLRFYYSVVDMSLDSGRGAVTEKNVPIIQNELLSYSRLAACKHANGRDWWIVKNAYSVNKYYTFLLTPDGVQGPFIQNIGPGYGTDVEESAYSVFSPDGNKYASVAGTSNLVVMDFDRCTGLFSNPKSFFNDIAPPFQPTTSGGVGLAFSPNNRFLYVVGILNLNQYDLGTSPAQDSIRIVTLGTLTDTFNMREIQLAPNGKIYIGCWNGGSYKVHVIDEPDSLGLACNFHLYGQNIATPNAQAIPYFPNYRLGALAGSGCDTLTGIPPIQPATEEAFVFSPVPASGYLTLSYHAHADFAVRLYAVTGQRMKEINMRAASTSYYIDIDAFKPGIYFYEILRDKAVLQRGNLSVVK